jgi:Fe-S cluster assembly protein SufD
MNENTEVSKFYSGLYTDNINKIKEGSSSFINSFRDEAFNKFIQLGVPTRKNEDYKYTDLTHFFRHNYKTYFIPDESDFFKAEEFRCDVTDLDTHGIVLMNGFYPTINGKLDQLPGGITIGSLNEAARQFPDIVEKHYGKYVKNNSDGLIHLNTAMASDGVFIHVPRGAVLLKPVQVVNLIQSAQEPDNS